MLILCRYTCACDSSMIFFKPCKYDMELTHCSRIEHRYCWIAKDIGYVPSYGEGFSKPKTKDSVVCTDACNQGLGGVCTQDNRVVGPRRSSRSYHWTSENAKGAPRFRGGYTGAGGCHVIGTSIFVLFCRKLRAIPVQHFV